MLQPARLCHVTITDINTKATCTKPPNQIAMSHDDAGVHVAYAKYILKLPVWGSRRESRVILEPIYFSHKFYNSINAYSAYLSREPIPRAQWDLCTEKYNSSITAGEPSEKLRVSPM